jgi:hypothetical protein
MIPRPRTGNPPQVAVDETLEASFSEQPEDELVQVQLEEAQKKKRSG